MKTRLDFMRRTFLNTLAFGIALFTLTSASFADWVAYNDQLAGTGTSPYATTNDTRQQQSRFLKNIANGTNLPVTLAITHSAAGVSYTNSGSVPPLNSPLYNAFNGFVTFSGGGLGTDANVEITTNGTVTYTFTGLNPAKLYSFKAGAVRGLAPSLGSNRWTRVDIIGATAFSSAHSSHVILPLQAPADLATNQIAINFATNQNSGDIIDWENINPGADGGFAIVCNQYTGLVPNGGSSKGTNGYAITGIRLEELGSGPPVITTQPQDQNVTSGQTATFSVVATGLRPLFYQWYRNGSIIPGATNVSYTTPPTSITDFGAKFAVMVYNSINTTTSSDATLTVNLVPFALIPLTNSWKYNQSAADLGTAWREVDYTNDVAWPSGR